MSSACELCAIDSGDATEKGSAIILHRIVKSQDGKYAVTVCRWPARTTIDNHVLETASPEFVTVNGDTVTFRVANGRATYRVEHSDPWRLMTTMVLVDHEVSGQEAGACQS